jgi:deoxycytidylate deaminase
MACVLVAPPHDDGLPKKRSVYDGIISVSTNLPFYSENDSDVHAEVAALGRAARAGVATDEATAYITMPPCKKCFSALTVSGVSRIVTRLAVPPAIAAAASQHGVQMVQLETSSSSSGGGGGDRQRRERLNLLIHGNAEGNHSLQDQEGIEEQRKRRKQQRQERKQKKSKGTPPAGT